MKKLLYILLPFLFGFKSEKKSPIQYRSFYAEMKALEKPSHVTAFGAVQTAGGSSLSSTTTTITLSGTTANNLVVVNIFILSTNSFTSVTDNQSNSYAVASNSVWAGSYRVVQAYGVQLTGGVTTVTVTVGSATDITAIADEYSGFSGTPTNAEIFDKIGTQEGDGVADYNCQLGTAIAPVQAGCLMVGGLFSFNTQINSAGTGYTLYGLGGTYYGGVYNKSMYKLSSGTSEVGPFVKGDPYSFYELLGSYKQESWLPPTPLGKAIRSAGGF